MTCAMTQVHAIHRSPSSTPAEVPVVITNATDDTFVELVIESPRPVVVDFWAAWCGPCRMVAPEIEKLAAKYEGAVEIVKLDVDANPEVSAMLGIQSIPTIAFFPGAGQQPVGVVGFQPAESLEEAFGLKQYLAEPAVGAA
jgi:thioredoxin